MKHDSSTGDLFSEESFESAATEFETWFESWLADSRHVGRLRQTSSEEVYRAMWGGLTQWCLSQRPVVRMGALTVEDLRLFIATRQGVIDSAGDLAPRYVWRLLHLVDRVLAHATRETKGMHNTAAADLIASQPEVKYANATESALPAYLPAHEARTLVTFLSHVRPRSLGPGEANTWNQLRNHAAVALQLGAGLAPGDVRALTLQSVVIDGGRLKGVPWKLVVPKDGNTPEHETPVAQWAGQLLRYWMTVRAELNIPGEWLFPSTKTGKPWAKVPQYEAAKQVLANAGLDSIEGGSFRLRHTFALRQLRRGKSPADVARWMGIANVGEMERYLRVLSTPVDVV